ncbi:MAG: leucine-rich repeat protein [Clostridia bacterium]|nr:leucine-rich repeat protein [Clostridia bacterium]
MKNEILEIEIINDIDKTCEIKGFKKGKFAEVLTIEPIVDGYTVIGIGKNAFENALFREINIPLTVSYIDDFAFQYCVNLKTVNFEKGSHLEEIGSGAFVLCRNLKQLFLPDTVKSIKGNFSLGIAKIGIIGEKNQAIINYLARGNNEFMGYLSKKPSEEISQKNLEPDYQKQFFQELQNTMESFQDVDYEKPDELQLFKSIYIVNNLSLDNVFLCFLYCAAINLINAYNNFCHKNFYIQDFLRNVLNTVKRMKSPFIKWYIGDSFGKTYLYFSFCGFIFSYGIKHPETFASVYERIVQEEIVFDNVRKQKFSAYIIDEALNKISEEYLGTIKNDLEQAIAIFQSGTFRLNEEDLFYEEIENGTDNIPQVENENKQTINNAEDANESANDDRVEIQPIIEEPEEEFTSENEQEVNKWVEQLEILDDEPLREIHCSKTFIADYERIKKRNKALSNKIDVIRKKLCCLPDSQFRLFLNSKNCKKMKGQEGVYKFRLTQAARITLEYIKNPNTTREDKVLCLQRIIDGSKHDRQGEIAQQGRTNTTLGIVKRHDEYESVNNDLLFHANTFLPILDDNQMRIAERFIEPPCIINGSAGSGKTCIAVEMYKQYTEYCPGNKVIYITRSNPLVERVKEDLIKQKIDNPNCMTYMEFAGVNKKDVYSDDDLLSFFKTKCNYQQEYKKIDFTVFKLLLNCFIRGDASLLEKKQTMVSKDVFNKLAIKEGFAENLDIIYKLAEQYEQDLKKSNKLDNNDISRKILKEKSKNKYDLMLIDETQDFSYLELQALMECCKDSNFVLFGDRNQVVTGSTFDFGIFERDFITKNNLNRGICKETLKNTYRCGQKLISYINKLSEKRQAFIGKQDYLDDEKEQSKRHEEEDDMYAVLVTEGDAIKSIIEKGAESANCHIIVDNEQTKQDLINLLKQSNSEEQFINIVTVEESKGLDYQVVLLYGFVQDNIKLFEEIKNRDKNAKRSTLHRIAFNKYYVACTRAEDKIFVCDAKKHVEKIRDLLFEDILECNDADTLEAFLDDSPEGWLNGAIVVYEKKWFEKASKYFKKYIEKYPEGINDEKFIDYNSRCEAHLKILELLESKEINKEEISSLAKQFEEKEPEYAKSIYEKIGNKYRACIMNIKMNNISDHLINELMKIINNQGGFDPDDIELLISSKIFEIITKKITNNINGGKNNG